MSSTDKNEIVNASEVIERFGGIRPMATKMEVPVTTVQGWKKRNVIPGTRRGDLLAAAGTHGIEITDLLAANDNDVAVDRSPVSQAADVVQNDVEDEAPGGYDREEEIEAIRTNGDAERERSFESFVGPQARSSGWDATATPAAHSRTPAATTAKAEQLHESSRLTSGEQVVYKDHGGQLEKDDLSLRLANAERKAVAKSAWINLFILLVTLGSVAALLWPHAREVQESGEKLAALEQGIADVKEEQSMLRQMIPDDWEKQVSDIQAQVESTSESVGKALEKAGEVSGDVLGENAGTLSDRLAKLESHVADITGSPTLVSLLSRLRDMGGSVEGQEQLSQTVEELSALLGAVDGVGDESVDIGAALDSARQHSAVLGESFDGIPGEDLKASAMLMGLSQFRSSLGRDNVPFTDDLTVLKHLAGDQNAELQAALEKLAPYAEEGVLSPSGLAGEFRDVAGEIVVSSIKGEDVSIQEKATARFNEIFNVEKDGEMLTGTVTQVTVDKAQKLLDEGRIREAITVLEELEGPAAETAQPWVERARATMLAQEAVVLAGETIYLDDLGLKDIPAGDVLDASEAGFFAARRVEKTNASKDEAAPVDLQANPEKPSSPSGFKQLQLSPKN